MIDAQNKTITLYSYQSGIGANTEAILNRTLRHILYGDLYDGGGNGGGVNGGNGNGGNGWGGIPSNEMHFTTLEGSVDYVGTQGVVGAGTGYLANWANSAAPASATLSNTTAGYTSLGGQFL